jgi:hypothetical protein
MALVRCPKHGIPYNEDNPRGCPACALEQEGGDQAQVMRELARTTQAIRRPGGAPADTPPPAEVRRPRRTERAAPPVTTPPRIPVAEPGPLTRVLEAARRRPIPFVGIPLSAILLAGLLLRSGPEFLAQPSPAPASGPALPLPIEPGAPLVSVFAVLGTQQPQPDPDHPALERYAYGTDLTIDALNGSVYAITLLVPNRTWHGLQVGVPERQTQGALALLGPPQQVAPQTTPRADTLAGLVVYPSLDQRPTRSLKAEVRPPNGCYDAIVDIQPRTTGVLLDAGRRYAAVGPPQTQLEWVATKIQIIDRAQTGPLGDAAC